MWEFKGNAAIGSMPIYVTCAANWGYSVLRTWVAARGMSRFVALLQTVCAYIVVLFVCYTQKNNLRLGLTFLTMPMNGQLPVERLGKYVNLTTYSPNLDFTRNLFTERKVQYEAVDWHT